MTKMTTEKVIKRDTREGYVTTQPFLERFSDVLLDLQPQPYIRAHETNQNDLGRTLNGQCMSHCLGIHEEQISDDK